jgi:hypothetical protein
MPMVSPVYKSYQFLFLANKKAGIGSFSTLLQMIVYAPYGTLQPSSLACNQYNFKANASTMSKAARKITQKRLFSCLL